MQSTALNLTAYLDEVPDDSKPVLARLRNLCRSELTAFEDLMKYGMPSYSLNGEVAVGFSSQKTISPYTSQKQLHCFQNFWCKSPGCSAL
jgi:uncharacterized protein YdhG (YjbR/CyaY superfamily)